MQPNNHGAFYRWYTWAIGGGGGNNYIGRWSVSLAGCVALDGVEPLQCHPGKRRECYHALTYFVNGLEISEVTGLLHVAHSLTCFYRYIVSMVLFLGLLVSGNSRVLMVGDLTMSQ